MCGRWIHSFLSHNMYICTSGWTRLILNLVKRRLYCHTQSVTSLNSRNKHFHLCDDTNPLREVNEGCLSTTQPPYSHTVSDPDSDSSSGNSNPQTCSRTQHWPYPWGACFPAVHCIFWPWVVLLKIRCSAFFVFILQPSLYASNMSFMLFLK